MTKVINTSPNGEEVRDMNAEELAQLEKDKVSGAEFDASIQTQKDLKASAKAKLIAGEALTAEEADTIVL
tara:strand:- start:1184 stop:1393 length:210 start_codon:yes stop_codon:yes gene_type:complete